MDICQGMRTIKKVLEDKTMPAEDKLKRIEWLLPDDRYKFYSTKDLILESAKKSPNRKFRLLATMNDPMSIFNWCDAEYNYIGMAQDPDYVSDSKNYTVEYTIEELSEVIDNAERYLREIKQEGSGMSGSPYFISSLQLMII